MLIRHDKYLVAPPRRPSPPSPDFPGILLCEEDSDGRAWVTLVDVDGRYASETYVTDFTTLCSSNLDMLSELLDLAQADRAAEGGAGLDPGDGPTSPEAP